MVRISLEQHHLGLRAACNQMAGDEFNVPLDSADGAAVE